jgi:hypothetical protein
MLDQSSAMSVPVPAQRYKSSNASDRAGWPVVRFRASPAGDIIPASAAADPGHGT